MKEKVKAGKVDQKVQGSGENEDMVERSAVWGAGAVQADGRALQREEWEEENGEERVGV